MPSLWFKVFLLVITCSPAYAQVALGSGARLTASANSTNTLLHLKRRGHTALNVKVDVDGTIAPGTTPRLKLIAEVPDSIVLVTETYPSIPGGLSYCQSGEEQYLRILRSDARKLVETFHVKLASCRDNLELADPGVTWNGPTKKLTIEWLAGPGTQGKPETKVLSLDALGRVSPDAKQ